MATDAGEVLERDGWVLLPSAVPHERIDGLAEALETAYRNQRIMQLRNGVGEGTDGTVHHLPCADGAFLDLLRLSCCVALLDRFFEGPYILNTYGGVLNLPDNSLYGCRVH